MDYTTTALLASIRRRAALPAAVNAGTQDSDLLALANEELQNWLVPNVMQLREDYFLFRHLRTMTPGTSEYRIPARAVGQKLRELDVVQSDGCIRNLTRIEPDELEEWNSDSQGRPEGFYLRGSYVTLVPTPSEAESLRFTFFIRPGELVATTAVRAITNIDTGTGDITVASTIPGAFTTAARYDLVAGTSGFEHLAIDLTASAAASSTVTFAAADLPSGLAVGDYVCLAEQSPFPQVPADFHPLLAQRVGVKKLESLGLKEKLAAAKADLRDMLELLRVVYAPRVDGEAKIVSPGVGGLMGGTSWAWSREWD